MSVSSKAPNPEKGVRYLDLLDQALCNGSWSEVLELARKVEKHAPHRECLTLTARSEAQIASASHRPVSASSTSSSSIHGLSELVPKLREAAAVGNSIEEDAYAATTCLAEILWLQEEHLAALEALPRQAPQPSSSASHPALGWLEVCNVKGLFIKAAALEATGQREEAQKMYQMAVTQVPGSRTPELRRWTERLLARACMFDTRWKSAPSTSSLNPAYRAFRAWGEFWQRAPAQTARSGANASRVDIPRRHVWRAYYALLSVGLQYGLFNNPYPKSSSDMFIDTPSAVSDVQYASAKLRQHAELKRVEATYESLLLNETQFPKASQSNSEVEDWIEQVVSNWKIVCGSDWADGELGDGGKESVGRGVLDILYRAATRTFHSTAILRDLFTVHTSLGEFDLAMHAFDSYTEIVGKGKARAEKTGERELGFDDNDTAIMTAAEAVRMLCRYGDREQAEKALEVGETIQKWLGQQWPSSPEQALATSNDNRAEGTRPPSQPTGSLLKPKTLAAAYRAIGISEAHWARLTYETERRPELQATGLMHLKRSYSHDGGDIETSYALALLLAETREVAAAIQVLRSTLSPAEEAEDEANGSTDYSRQRKLIPLWHLLAQCLTAQDQHETAAKMCEAAFEQFGEPTVLFGQALAHSTVDPEKQASYTRLSRSIVDQMEGFEKEGIIQIKVSQLTFIELMEGPHVAVDSSDELLGLYARLFGSPDQPKLAMKPPPTAASAAPTKTGGTLRSIAGSIRPKTGRSSLEKQTFQQPSNASDPGVRKSADSGGRGVVTNGQAIGAPIAITVTNEDGVPANKAHRGRHEHKHHLPFKLRSHHDQHRGAANLRSSSAEGMREKGVMHEQDKPPPPPPKDTEVADYATSAGRALPTSAAANHSTSPDAPMSPEQPLGKMAHNAPHDAWPTPAGHEEQPPEQDVRLPTAHPASASAPETRFPTAQQRRHKISLLVKLWLFIAGLYERAEMLDDAGGAIEEANKLVAAFETEVAAEHASARSFFFKGWGGGKGVDELWADVWSARGDLAAARQQPFEAMAHYEQALTHYPDHSDGIIGLADLLMDIYEEKIPAEKPKPSLVPPLSPSTSLINAPATAARRITPPRTQDPVSASKITHERKGRRKDPTPAELNRLAARDRAYMLLSNLTRLGTGWDNSEAWFTLSRAHELSKQVARAKQALWWVVELEDAKPMRPWTEVTAGGFTL